MGRSKIKIPKQLLIQLYQKQKLSPYKIENLLNCSFSTISNRLKEHGIPRRTKAQAQMRYPKKDFDGDGIEKSYLIGFRLGDLNVYIPSKNSEIVVARCHTTDRAQVRLMEQLFSRYGQVSLSQSRYGWNINCFLNKSFLFLLPKQDKVENRIKKDRKCCRAFAAGYIDAEGNFILNQGKARFKIDSYDKGILKWMYNWCRNNHIRSKLRLIVSKNNLKWGQVFKQNLWRINVNEAHSILRLLKLIFPYLKHPTRVRQALLMRQNIINRRNKKTI
jgi:hypothetical protein